MLPVYWQRREFLFYVRNTVAIAHSVAEARERKRDKLDLESEFRNILAWLAVIQIPPTITFAWRRSEIS